MNIINTDDKRIIQDISVVTVEPSAGQENAAALSAGTVLDRRYTLLRIIGQGGFGITYEAVHLQTGEHVAIKEYFCREICVRTQLPKKSSGYIFSEKKPPSEIKTDDRFNRESKSGERWVTVANPVDLSRFEGDRARFLREARILREFSGEPAVVEILDYFEENGTAYIVMEYLDGKTLREEILKNGTWSMKEATIRLTPVMEVLSRIHAAGVLHRDISPDNLMVLPDGTLRLLDFGAARNLPGVTTTHSAIYTGGYSAPEQRDENGHLGSWTDVYGLCSTIWFCLTGRDPEDALSRLLYDELERPSEKGVEILPKAEQVLLQGMALDSSRRIQDMDILREELERVYPNLTEEEKKKKQERRRWRTRMAAAAAAAVLLCVSLICAVFRTQIRFHFIDVQEAALDGSGMSSEEYEVSAKAMKARVETFAGKGNYLWREHKGQRILTEIPSEIFGDEDPEIFMKYILSQRMCLQIYIGDAPYSGREIVYDRSEYNSYGSFTQDRDVESVEKTGEGWKISFTEKAADRFAGALDSPGKQVLITFDEDKSGYFYERGYTAGDGRSIVSTGTDGDEEGVLLLITDELRRRFYTEAPLPAPFDVECGLKARWEKADSALLPGKNQKNAEAIPGPYIDLSYYSPGYLFTGTEKTGYNATMVSLQALFKNRLDSLGIPYAVGIKQSDPSQIMIRVPEKGVYREEIDRLGRNIDQHIGGITTLSDNYLIRNTFHAKKRTDGRYSLDLTAEDSLADSIREDLKILEDRGEEKVYLYVWGVPVAYVDLKDAVRSFDEEGRISFTRWCYDGDQAMDERTVPLLRFLISCMEEDPGNNLYLREAQFSDREGRIDYFHEGKLPELISDPAEQWTRAWMQQHNEKKIMEEEYETASTGLTANLRQADTPDMAHAVVPVMSYDKNKRAVEVRLFGCRLDDPGECMKAFREVLTAAEKSGIHNLEFDGVFYENLFENRANDFQEGRTHYIYVVVNENFRTGEKRIQSGFPGGTLDDDKERAAEVCDRFNLYVQETPYWSKMLTGYKGETPFSP